VTAASFAIAAASTLSVPEGTSGGTGIAITTTGGFGGQIALAASGQPTGVTVAFNPATVTGAGSSTLTATVAAGVPQGTYALTVKATSGNLSKTLVINLVVVAPGYALTVSGPVTATQGGSGSATLTAAASGGFSGTIALTASGLPAGVTASFAPTTITGGGTAKLTLAASSSARVGTYTVSVTGTSGTVTRAVPVTLTVN
jgi:uncharacterized membrane protein